MSVEPQPGGVASADEVAGVDPAPPLPRLAHSLSWNLIADVFARGASLWLALFCARALSVADFGRFTFALALAQYLWLIGDATLNGGYAARQLARGPAERGAPRRALPRGPARRRRPAHRRSAMALLGAPLPRARAPRWPRRACSSSPTRRSPTGSTAAAASSACSRSAIAVYAIAVVGHAAAAAASPRPGHRGGGVGGSFALGSGLVAMAAARRGRLAPESRHSGLHFRRSAVFAVGSIFGIGCVQMPAS